MSRKKQPVKSYKINRFTKTGEKGRSCIDFNPKICTDEVDEILKIEKMIKLLQPPYLFNRGWVFCRVAGYGYWEHTAMKLVSE